MTQAAKPTPQSRRNAIIGIVIFALVLIGFVVLINSIGADRLREWVRDAGPAAPLIYILIRIVLYVFAPLSVGPIQILSATLFGTLGGIVYSAIGELIGGSINFWIGRKLGRSVVTRLIGQEALDKAQEYFNLLGDWRGLAIVRILGFAIWDFLSYVIGLSPAKFIHYLLVSATIGVIPIAASIFFGSQLDGDNPVLLVVSIILLGILFALPIIFRDRLKQFGKS